MTGIVYDGCMTSGHGDYSPTAVIASQTNVCVNGIPIVVHGDKIKSHPHDGTVIASQTKVKINGIPVCMKGDKTTCGDTIAQGNEKVLL